MPLELKEPPRYVPDSSWSRSITRKMEEVERVSTKCAKHLRTTWGSVKTFAISRDPSNSRMYVFTRMPGKSSKKDPMTSDLVRVCPIEENQINEKYLAEIVNPQVNTIRGNRPPYISNIEIKARNAADKTTLKTAAVPAFVAAGAFVVAYGSYAYGSHWKGLGWQTVKAAAEIATGSPLGQTSMGIAGISALNSLYKYYLGDPTHKKATFSDPGEGVHMLDGPSSHRITGKPARGELQRPKFEAALDPSVSLPGWGRGACSL